MPITHLQVISVPVSDQDHARAFYQDMLGFELVQDQPMGPDRRWVQLSPKGAQTSITLVTWFETMKPGSLDGIVIESNNLDADHAELTRKGLKLTPIESEPWGRFSTFDDLDGNGWVLYGQPG